MPAATGAGNSEPFPYGWLQCQVTTIPQFGGNHQASGEAGGLAEVSNSGSPAAELEDYLLD